MTRTGRGGADSGTECEQAARSKLSITQARLTSRRDSARRATGGAPRSDRRVAGKSFIVLWSNAGRSNKVNFPREAALCQRKWYHLVPGSKSYGTIWYHVKGVGRDGIENRSARGERS